MENKRLVNHKLEELNTENYNSQLTNEKLFSIKNSHKKFLLEENSNRYDLKESNDLEKEMEIIEKIIETEQGVEDERKSSELFNKLVLQDLILAIFTLISIGSYIIYYENRMSESITDLDDIKIILPLWIMTINNLLFSMYKVTIAELLLIFFSPNIYFHKIKHITTKEDFLIEIEYEINDLLCVLIFFRIYVIFRSFINFSKFYSARSLRVSKMMGGKMTRMFAMRCLLNTNPYLVLSLTIGICTFCLAYMIKIIEGPIFNLLPDQKDLYINYSQMENCFWNILVTMTTVGYGDFYPQTNLGRSFLILAALLGQIFMSLLIYTLQIKLNFKPNEENAFRFFIRMMDKEEIHKKGAAFFKSTFTMLSSKNKFVNYLKSGKNDPNEYNNLKENLTNSLYTRIKNTKSYKNKFHNFRVTHQPFTTFDVIKNKMNEISSKIEFLSNEINNSPEESKEKSYDYETTLKLREDLIKIKEKILEEKEMIMNKREIANRKE